jgi:hypothetical protein
MSELKTKPTRESAEVFLDNIENQTRKKDGKKLFEIFKEVTKEEPVMWGSSIIGFGSYDYKTKSNRKGTWFKSGFSPRKRNLTLYVGYDVEKYREELDKLGKHRTGKGCVYINKLSDVDLDVIKDIIAKSMEMPDYVEP